MSNPSMSTVPTAIYSPKQRFPGNKSVLESDRAQVSSARGVMEQTQPLMRQETYGLPVSTATSNTVETPYHLEDMVDLDDTFETRTFKALSKSRSYSRRRKGRNTITHLGSFVRSLLFFVQRRRILSFLSFMALAAFGTMVGFTIKYILDPDKERMPWREDCATQPPFLNEDTDHLAPVDLFVGVMSYDKSFERRQAIRHTYATMTLPEDPQTGQVLGNIQVKFILGRPRKAYAQRVAMEMEMYNDLVILDMRETSNSYKTLRFFKWAAENGTVPILVPRKDNGLIGAPSLDQKYDVHWKLADYVMKADDDSFIVLDQLERRLRLLPRKMVYWGYLVRGWFMAGEAYALSHDLVKYIANSEEVAKVWHSKEDTKMAKWMRMHPRSDEIQWVSEHCWIYDHPRSWTPYAHGFLFPDYVEEVRREAREGLNSEELRRRGGPYYARSYSTTSKWKVPYKPPRPDLSAEETVEALVEGGGRWRNVWYRQDGDEDSQRNFAHDTIVFDANDPRLSETDGSTPRSKSAVEIAGSHGLSFYPNCSMNRKAEHHPHYAPVMNPYGATYAPFYEALARQRYQDYKVGGTVVVHYCKKNEWFYETALALLGRHRTWSAGSGGAGKHWRMSGSPLVQPYSHATVNIAAGRHPPS